MALPSSTRQEASGGAPAPTPILAVQERPASFALGAVASYPGVSRAVESVARSLRAENEALMEALTARMLQNPEADLSDVLRGYLRG